MSLGECNCCGGFVDTDKGCTAGFCTPDECDVCARCGGKGKIDLDDGNPDERIRHFWDECPDCVGRGVIRELRFAPQAATVTIPKAARDRAMRGEAQQDSPTSSKP